MDEIIVYLVKSLGGLRIHFMFVVFCSMLWNWAAIGNEKADFSVAHSIDMFFYFLKFYIIILFIAVLFDLILIYRCISKETMLRSVNEAGKYVAVAVVCSTYIYQYFKVHNFNWFERMGKCFSECPLIGKDIVWMLLFSFVMLVILCFCSKVLLK